MNMNQRLVLKTILICVGCFIIILAFLVFFFFKNIEIDNEERYEVIIATKAINVGDVVNESMVMYKTIKASSLTPNMVLSVDETVGKKALDYIGENDYIRKYELLDSKEWYSDDSRKMVLKMGIEERLANLIKKGSLVDIKVKLNSVNSVPLTVLSKVRVEDIINDLGESAGTNAIGREIYGVFTLDEESRNRIYAAQSMGTLIFELYCNEVQEPLFEEFEIPEEYLMK